MTSGTTPPGTNSQQSFKPANSQEQELQAALALAPDRFDLALKLSTTLTARGAEIPLEIEEKALRALLEAEPERADLLSRLCAVLTEQAKPVPLELEEQALRALVKQQPEREDLVLRLCSVLTEAQKPVPAELEELALRALVKQQPEREDLALRLCSLLMETQKPVPPELEELALRALVKQQPERGDLALRLCSVLAEAQKPVPAELEELTLRALIREQPERDDLVLRLCSLLMDAQRPVPAELEELSLAASLAREPQRADLAVRLAHLLGEQGKRLDSAQAGLNWCLSTDPHTRSLEPFVFIHIPKTAGSIVRLILLSLFDQSRVFPGWNFEDYDTRFVDLIDKVDPAQHGVFVGHMMWDAVVSITEALQIRPTLFTVLRDPADHYRSQMAFVDKLAKDGITQTIMGGREVDFVKFWDASTRKKLGSALVDFQHLSLLDWKFTGVDRTSVPWRLQQPDSEVFEILKNRLTHINTAFFEDLRRSLDLFCSKLGLPYQYIPAMRLNPSEADHAAALSDAELARIKRDHARSFAFDAMAREGFEREYSGAFEGIDDIPGYLNSGYRDALRQKLPRCWCVKLDAGSAWPGYGWGFRESNEHGQSWRQPGPDGRATIIARLNSGCSYVVSLVVHSADSEHTMAQVSATANGNKLTPEDRSFVDNQYILNWLMPDTSLDTSTGLVELAFEAPASGPGGQRQLNVSAIVVRPAAMSA